MALLAAGLTRLLNDVIDFLPAVYFDFDRKDSMSYDFSFQNHLFKFVKNVTTVADRPPPRYINYRVFSPGFHGVIDIFVYGPLDPTQNLLATKRALARLLTRDLNDPRAWAESEYA